MLFIKRLLLTGLLLTGLLLLTIIGVTQVSAVSVNINASIPSSGGGFIPPPPPPIPIPGCTDPSANNYNSSATVDDGSCTYSVSGCTDPTAINYNASATVDNGSCTYAILGCTNPVADNYDPTANTDDGSCIYPLIGCTDPTATNYNPGAITDDGSCTYDIYGCTNPIADNYNPSAVDDDGSCIISGCTNINADNYNASANTDNGTCIISGCTNPLANNYNSTANNDDGTCIILGCTNVLADNYNLNATIDDGTCVLSGCTNPLAVNYNSAATNDNGTCLINGCTDPTAVNYNSLATTDNGTCSYDKDLIPGCTDTSASNYNSKATIDNGSCTYPVSGCTDSQALNYKPSATLDNGSCAYPLPPVPPGGGPGFPAYYFYTNNNGLQLSLGGIRKNTINLLVGKELTILVSDGLSKTIDNVYATLDGQVIAFKHDSKSNRYVLSLSGFKTVGKKDLLLFIDYTTGQTDQTNIIIESHRLGSVFSKLPEDRLRVFGISLFLYDKNDQVVVGLNRISDEGTYGFMVANGQYKLVVYDNGEKIYSGRLFSVKNNIVNKNIGLSLWEQILETAVELMGEVGDLALGVGGLINDEVLNNPVVEDANYYTAPVVVSVASVTTLISIPWWSFVHYLQYFFTEPLAWLFRKRKQSWGVIYNSITKQPIDLAVVRLYDKKTSRLLKSKVTDKFGRYSFLVSEGEYTLEVIKPEMIFPSAILMETDDDKQFTNLYHGESIHIDQEQKGVITANIPLDSKDAKVSDKDILIKHFQNKVKKNIHFIGPVLAVVSLAISPTPLIILFTVIHLLLFLIFNRLAVSAKATKWGIVLDAKTGEPVTGSVTKIYSPEYDKMLEAQVTDRYGRYGFLAGNNVYYITASKGGYDTSKTGNIDLTHQRSDEIIGQDIILLPSSGNESAVGGTITSNPSIELDSKTKQASADNSDESGHVQVKDDSDLREIAKRLNEQAVESQKKHDSGSLSESQVSDYHPDDPENHHSVDENKFG